MSAGTIQERFPGGGSEAFSRSIYVGENSKLIAGMAFVASNTSIELTLQMFALGGWITISFEPLTDVGIIRLPIGIEGNLPAGTEVRVRASGEYADADVFLMTS